MQAPDPIEVILARLMPPALSQEGQAEINALFEKLAGPEPEAMVAIFPVKKWLTRCLLGGGVAAAVAGLVAALPLIQNAPKEPTVAAVFAPLHEPTGFVLVSGSDRIESVTDEGWQEDSDGSAMHALRLRAVEENNVRDELSGMVVRISEPREEILFTPINAF